ncbi:MAG: cation:proton antiporter [Bacteroidales bacterium]|nr:cation:proton antiporter [Bacteroidales bacterium]
MFGDSYFLIILTSLLVIVSYAYSALSKRLMVPSVLLLMGTGIGARFIFDRLGYTLPYLKTIVEFLGIVGLILIVLEGALDLRLHRKKLWLMLRAFLSAIVILLVSSFSIAYVMQLFHPEFSFYICLVNAIPLAVISSAIAIPSVQGIKEEKKEFIVYESIFSDILGILLFNAVLNNPTFEIGSALWLISDFVIVIVVGVVISVLILFFIEKTTMNIKFFLLLAIMVMLYAFGKMIHLSSLLMILIFGMIFNNLDLLTPARISKFINVDNLRDGIDRFKMITNESAFLIRTFFFFIFGFTLQLALFNDPIVLLSGLIVVGILYLIRYLYLTFLARRNLFPELFIAPRGLITILLYYAIPAEYSKGIISEGILFMVILLTSLIMMIGLMSSGRKMPPTFDIYMGDKKLNSD